MRAQRMSEATTRPILDRRSGAVANDAELEIDGRAIRFTNLDRVMWPETGFTKAELVAYYVAIAPALLPHLADRAITVGRFPGGVDGRGFAQAEVPGRPAWLRAIPLRLANGEEKAFTLIDDRAGLAWLAQMGTIELHTFLGHTRALAHPTAILFDLDPSAPAGLLEAAEAALALRARLDARGLSAIVKTSGSLGVHVSVPIDACATYDETRGLAREVARELANAEPSRITDRMPRAERAGRVLVDVRQNAERLTTVVPYSLRTTPRPSVSMPVTWDEIDQAVRARDPDRLVFGPADALARAAR